MCQRNPKFENATPEQVVVPRVICITQAVSLAKDRSFARSSFYTMSGEKEGRA